MSLKLLPILGLAAALITALPVSAQVRLPGLPGLPGGGRPSGSELLRRWVDDAAASPADLDALALADEAAWLSEREPVLLYR